MPSVRAITWVKQRGAEFAEIDLAAGRMRATGVVVGASPLPYRLEYELDCAGRYVTRRLSVRVRGAGWSRRLDLDRDPRGRWSVAAGAEGGPQPSGLPSPGGDAGLLDEALDCDLGESPVTNTMPVLREGLLAGGAAGFVVAWVSVPALAVSPARQRYLFLRRAGGDGESSVIRYQSGTFAADVTFDADGVVTDYPGLGRVA
jgi:hypothetical protein